MIESVKILVFYLFNQNNYLCWYIESYFTSVERRKSWYFLDEISNFWLVAMACLLQSSLPCLGYSTPKSVWACWQKTCWAPAMFTFQVKHCPKTIAGWQNNRTTSVKYLKKYLYLIVTTKPRGYFSFEVTYIFIYANSVGVN